MTVRDTFPELRGITLTVVAARTNEMSRVGAPTCLPRLPQNVKGFIELLDTKPVLACALVCFYVISDIFGNFDQQRVHMTFTGNPVIVKRVKEVLPIPITLTTITELVSGGEVDYEAYRNEANECKYENPPFHEEHENPTKRQHIILE
jgi:hypothetical protein